MSSTYVPKQTPVFDEAADDQDQIVTFENAEEDSSISIQGDEAADSALEPELVSSGGFLTSLHEAPAWAVSLVVHLAILLALGSITHVTQMVLTPDIISTPVPEIEEQTYKFDSTIQDELGNNSQMNEISPSLQAATLTGEAEPQEIERRLEESQLEVEIQVSDLATQPSRDELTEVMETKGTTEHTGGTEGAMDRLAFEISNAVQDHETLVVWLFDASLSVKERRDKIADRFHNIYEQVGLKGVGDGNDRLLTAAATFGEKTTFLIDEPTSNIGPLTDKIREIPADESGKEMVFTALEDVSRKWGDYRTKRRRNVMYIVVTDERGDDFDKMESVIANLSRVGIRVHCVGNAAVFGKEKGYVSFTWEEDGQSFTEALPVDQGPETFYPELLDIDFWGLTRRGNINRLSSSFGPYPLNRLCAETGGLFLVSQESNNAVTYDYDVMRAYQPDYSPINELDQSIRDNKAIAALIDATRALRIDRISMPTLSFDAENDNVLRNEIFEAQKPVSVLDYKISSLLAMLEEGSKERDKIVEPRWRAAFDLAMGRALALKVRAYGYGQMLAEMRTNLKPFEDPRSNFWYLRPSTDLKNATPTVRKMAKEAEEYLTRVINQHPGTPWSDLAKTELSQPMGWQWEEAAISKEGNVMTRNGNNDTARLLLADEIQRRRNRERPPQPKKRPKL
ncbi:MAG: VWA domain-containing protein [Planctomycetaceae bacterium]|nr:VWA domain-containing protein [Planctomycetaceae bacterium]